MKKWIKKQVVKWAGALAGAAVGVLVSLGLELPAEFRADLAVVITGLMMAVFTRLCNWLMSKWPYDLDNDPDTPY